MFATDPVVVVDHAVVNVAVVVTTIVVVTGTVFTILLESLRLP